MILRELHPLGCGYFLSFTFPARAIYTQISSFYVEITLLHHGVDSINDDFTRFGRNFSGYEMAISAASRARGQNFATFYLKGTSARATMSRPLTNLLVVLHCLSAGITPPWRKGGGLVGASGLEPGPRLSEDTVRAKHETSTNFANPIHFAS